MSSDRPTSREYAALAVALAITRGQLSAFLMGEADKEEVSRVLRGTSTANIALAIGARETDLAVDWNDFLNENEISRIEGRV